ncbi:metallophosphoesterase [Lachnospiraceae bacterium 29-84]
MKFIHIADVHLGAKPDRGKPWAREREDHSWQAFTNVITKAKEEQVQLLLIAGNLYHRQPLLQELKAVDYQFSRIPDTQVVLIAGNCDYLSQDSCYAAFPWGRNVHFLKEKKMRYVELEGIKARVYGLSYHRREISQPLYRNVRVEDDGFTNILLGHGGDERHIPFQASDFRKTPFDYVALGHLPTPMQLIEEKAVMAGALQPIQSRHTGEHGYFSGEIRDHACRVTFHPLHYCEYVPLNLKITPEIKVDELEKFVVDYIRKSAPHQIFRITLTGTCDPKAPAVARELERLERVALVADRCQAGYDFEELKKKYGKQMVGRYIRALEGMPQDEIVKKALSYGVEALMAE